MHNQVIFHYTQLDMHNQVIFHYTQLDMHNQVIFHYTQLDMHNQVIFHYTQLDMHNQVILHYTHLDMHNEVIFHYTHLDMQDWKDHAKILALQICTNDFAPFGFSFLSGHILSRHYKECVTLFVVAGFLRPICFIPCSYIWRATSLTQIKQERSLSDRNVAIFEIPHLSFSHFLLVWLFETFK